MGKQPTPRAPRLFVLAGTNGAGKSSIGGAAIRTHGGHYFNPDEASKAIRQKQPHLSTTQANSAAWHEGKRLLEHALARRLDYNFETTLGGRSFAKMLRQAADAGFEVRIWYVGLATPEHHMARVKARVAKGGHAIAEADIRRRFDQSRKQLIDLLPHLTELRVYDNTAEANPHQGIAPQPLLVLHWQKLTTEANQSAAGRVRLPAHAAELATLPAWVQPIVMAALKAQAAQKSVAPTKSSRQTSKP
jgi:predicted ABC-type ATPase